MRYPIAIFLILAGNFAYTQDWHKAGDTLKPPETIGNMLPSTRFTTRYDTIACIYTVRGSNQQRKGYKLVHIQRGFFSDDASTVHVFYDDRLRRIKDVERFHFN